MSAEADVLRDVVGRLDGAGIPYMINLLASGADENYLSGWAGKLGVDELLEECRNG